ncbi:MAG: hypothetical protein ACRD0A_05675 [Acidimicrobiales bacterium]
MGFPSWLRENSERYLLVAAQDRMAGKYGGRAPVPEPGFKPWFFRRLFVPIYRRLPWPVRSKVIRAMPGSHRRTWARRDRSTHQPAI